MTTTEKVKHVIDDGMARTRVLADEAKVLLGKGKERAMYAAWSFGKAVEKAGRAIEEHAKHEPPKSL